MNDSTLPAERFEEHRSHLRAVAYRMLGSLAEAEDAVQEAWLRFDRSDTDDVENLGGWLTTVVARVCLNVLRARSSRREDPLDAFTTESAAGPEARVDPEHEALLADAVGLALLVVLDTLTPSERVAFVLHDLFAVPFDDIAPMIEKTPAATRQLAGRARRRVRGRTRDADGDGGDRARQRLVVDAFLAATRGGDFDALLSLLHPGVVLRADRAVGPTPEPLLVTGAETVARGAMAAMRRARTTGPALVDGSAGLVMAPLGKLFLVLRFALADGRITEIDLVAEPDRLSALEIAVLTD
ncbi:sigma-70 family RNA polymerase sigma factor [Streptomyces sp. NPDC058611]|uniref:sigma-70 family RNA polymerase sigma factor n=1 Tax=unclassified Streptomyces TaxID=2593676 RepID=UPI003656E984